MRKLIFVALTLCLLASGATVPKKNKACTQKTVDIDLVVDSALILADNYADATATKPEMVKSRLNAIKRFFTSHSNNKQIADTICNTLYNVYVDNVERENNDRANAFKECFLAIADKNNKNLGPLYATELTIAQEKSDTTVINRFLPLLRDYSSQNGFDYDDEINSADNFLKSARTRKPIEDELIGIWVSDDMLKYPFLASVYGFSFGKAMSLMGGNSLSSSLNQKVSDSNVENAIIQLDFIGIEKNLKGGIKVVCFTGDNKIPFYSPQMNELKRYNLVVDESRINKKSKKRSQNWLYEPITSLADNNARWLYSLWGTEQLKKNNADLTAAVRQSIQKTHAAVVGHYSRSKYNFGDQLAANAIASGFSIMSNAIIDYFSVSKDKIYSAEINLQLQNPDKLVGRVDLTYTEVRSDNPVPKTKERNEEVIFYRWEVDDNVFFLTVMETYIPLFEPSKLEMKRMSEVVKRAKAYWKNNVNQGYFYQWFNELMFAKLQTKTNEVSSLSPELKSLTE